LGASSVRREKRLRKRVTADGAVVCAVDSVGSELLGGEIGVVEPFIGDASDIVDGVPSWLTLGVDDLEEDALP